MKSIKYPLITENVSRCLCTASLIAGLALFIISILLLAFHVANNPVIIAVMASIGILSAFFFPMLSMVLLDSINLRTGQRK